jgi:SPP1 family predicted phage head-tail adaptor
MPIRAGSLNRLFRFERRSDTRNEFNEQVGEWTEIARVYGELRSLNAREFFQAMQVQSEQSFRIHCRWTAPLAAIRTSDRIVSDDTVFDVQAVIDPTGRRRELDFLVIEHDETT